MSSRSEGRAVAAGAGSLRIAVIGGGLAGVITGVTLKRAGIDDFTIFEKSEGIGGTWWDNNYPGAEVDVASCLYSFSRHPGKWSQVFASRDEILEYVTDLAHDEGLDPHIRLGVAVDEARWDEESGQYSLRTSDGGRHFAHVVVSGLGMLNVPNYPQWPGMDEFAGAKFHTARWEHHRDLRGKTVAVVGTGSTAVQVVPAVAEVAKRVLVFQRQPGWVFPKGNRGLTAEERRRLRHPLHSRLDRLRTFWALQRGYHARRLKPDSPHQEMMRQAGLAFLERAVKDEALRAQLTPGFPAACRRPILSDDYYAALERDNVELIPNAVQSLTKRGIVDVTGDEHSADVLVMATGFQATNYLATLDVYGTDGRSLHEVWGTDPEAFLGLSVPGFPNFFMLYGPNTNGGVISFTLERQAEHITRTIKTMVRRRRPRVEVRRSWHTTFNRTIQWMLNRTVFVGPCHNYYRTPTGKVVTQWPRTQTSYWVLLRSLGRASQRFTSLGTGAIGEAAGHAGTNDSCVGAVAGPDASTMDPQQAP